MVRQSREARKKSKEFLEEAKREIEGVVEKAQEKAAQAKNQEGDAKDLMEHVAEQTLKHNLVLQRVYEKASELAKKGLLQAIEASQKGRENALKVLNKVKKK